MATNDDDLIKAYQNSGMSYEQACSMAGVAPAFDDMDAGDTFSDDELIEVNGSLAIRAIHKALKSGNVDNTMLNAAVRAVQMLEDARKKGVGDDPEDDMLRWVAEVEKTNKESENG